MAYSKPSDCANVSAVGNEDWREVDHAFYTKDQMLAVKATHVPAVTTWDKAAEGGVKLVRLFFDIGSGYKFGPISETKLLRRIVFLETVAGIPGIVAGTLRHLRSLRRIENDMGWIQTLLDEAENERMHLLVFREVQQPSMFMKATVAISQLVAWNAFFAFYLVSPSACHRFVGYIEEEAVHTYTTAIEALRSGNLPTWTNKPCPQSGIEYWGLPQNATMEDLLLAVRADEAHHRDVNHSFADLQEDEPNPFLPRKLKSTP